MFQLLALRAAANWLNKLAEETQSVPADSQGPDPRRPFSDALSNTTYEDPLSIYDPGDWKSSVKQTVDAPLCFPKVQREAMGSLWEIFLIGTNAELLSSAGEEALNEIERLDRQLSHYKPDSDISLMNAHAREQWVRLEPKLYHLLKQCATIWEQTAGAFDITMQPLVQAWGFHDGNYRVPPDDEIASILTQTGMQRVLWDDEEFLIYFTSPGIEIALSAVGKGFALDEAAAVLKCYDVERAVLHGGQSSILAIGAPPDAAGWEFAIRNPMNKDEVLETVYLCDESISTSGDYEQFFEVDGKRFTHILDPMTGKPVEGMAAVTVIAPTAAEADALSTAFFVLGREDTQEYCRLHPNVKVVMVEVDEAKETVVTRIGFDPSNPTNEPTSDNTEDGVQ